MHVNTRIENKNRYYQQALKRKAKTLDRYRDYINHPLFWHVVSTLKAPEQRVIKHFIQNKDSTFTTMCEELHMEYSTISEVWCRGMNRAIRELI